MAVTTSRIRYPVDLAGCVPAQRQSGDVDESGWHAGFEESGEPATGKLDRASSSRSNRFPRRRSEHVDEPRIPLHHCGARRDRAVHRYRHRRDHLAFAVADRRCNQYRRAGHQQHPSVARSLMRTTTVWGEGVESRTVAGSRGSRCDELEDRAFRRDSNCRCSYR